MFSIADTKYESRLCVKAKEYVRDAGCHAHETASGYMKRCFCFDDLCNSSSRDQTTFTITGLCLLSASFLKLFLWNESKGISLKITVMETYIESSEIVKEMELFNAAGSADTSRMKICRLMFLAHSNMSLWWGHGSRVIMGHPTILASSSNNHRIIINHHVTSPIITLPSSNYHH